VIKDYFVDIILPNYNNGKYLTETINSVLQQTYKKWRLYIIDDKSLDNSQEILNKYKKNKRINIIFLKKNKGVHFSRNLGIKLSKSRYISFLDSDDYWTKNKLKDQINFMKRFKHRFTYTNYTPFVLKNNKKKFKKKINPTKTLNYKQFLENTSISTSSMVINRSIVGKIKFPKVDRCEDYSFKCDLLKKGNIAVKLNKNSMYYRISKHSLQSSKLKTIYWVWYINKNFNKLTFLENLRSILLITLRSIQRYGIK
jgi:teichuronic acid biosynthesis glycosyltransferase TuaG